MDEKLKYVSPEYQQTLDELAETLRLDRLQKAVEQAVLADTVELGWPA